MHIFSLMNYMKVYSFVLYKGAAWLLLDKTLIGEPCKPLGLLCDKREKEAA